MKKTLLISALAMTLAVPVFAEEQFTNDKSRASSYPVFGDENPRLADMGMQEQDEAVKAAKRSESYRMANAAEGDNGTSLTTGRYGKDYGKKVITDPNDPDYVPPVQAKAKKHKQKEVKDDYSQLPVKVDGDHIEYENQTGDFVATGRVRIAQGPVNLATNYAFGNMKTGDIYLLEGGTILQPGNRTEGKWAHYNYNNKTGEMKEVKGRGFKDFYTAPHVFMMPDKMVADQGGVTTRCDAKKHVPCMHITAKTFEVYPKEKMVAHNVKGYVKGVQIYTRKLWINDMTDRKPMPIHPSVGWNGSRNGFYAKLEYDHPLNEKDDIQINWTQYSRAKFKPQYKFHHREKNWDFRYYDGWEEDGDNWYHKQSDFRLRYKPHHFIKGLPLTFSANYEYGLWSQWNTRKRETVHKGHGDKSWHREFAYYINHDPIKLIGPDTTLHLTYGRKWVHESLSTETTVTNMYYTTLRQKISNNLNVWVGDMREKKTSSLYEINNSDMDREFRAGIQYKPDKNNTFSIVNRYDYSSHRQYATTYTWYHRLCCWAYQLSYTKNWHVYEPDAHRSGDDARELEFQLFFYNW